MSRQEQLNAYIDRVERRLRLAVSVRGAAMILAAALLVTLAVVMVLNAYAFPLSSLPLARIILIVALILVAAIGLVLPLRHLTRSKAVHRTEAAFPAFEDRLLTFSERKQDQGNPIFELLAADTLTVAEDSSPADLVPPKYFYALMAGGVVSFGLLVWMIASGPGYLGYGASLLWTGPKKNAAPLYDIRVEPGNAALRRNTDQMVTAQLTGIETDKVQLFARYQNSARWEPVPMQRQDGASGYQFLFTALPENVEYYVTAGPMTTDHYTLRVVDMPSVTGIKVTYRYPAWTGMKPSTDDHGGDLRAIEGTEADLEIHTDRPLKDGLLVQDDGSPLKLATGEGNTYKTTVRMQKDGAYHIAGTDSGQQVRLSEDYFVATNKAEPPQIAIDKPARDYRASPIEEVTVKVKGSAEFGLHSMALHYSVNGGPEQTVPMLKQNGLRAADGSQTLSLENFKMQPGDVVALYATARDGHAEAKTDISFIQADPFEREFSQSQAGGGGGGGGGGGRQGDQGEISRRQKELIAATWKQQNDRAATPKANDDAGKFLSDVQSKLKQQVEALSSRLESRDMSGANESFSSFEKDMQQAAAAMVPSTDKLKKMQWKDAIAEEQKALQYLLRAEATFRQIQVAFGQRGGGGGGGGGSMGRDLATLLDLELDTEKNQYETAQTGSPQEEKEKKIDEALQKLDALAKRQEELAQQQRNNPQQSFQQRWQQEMLRREAEQLQKQMEQIAQNQQNGQQGQQGGQQGQQQSGQQGGQQSSSGSQSGSSSGQSGSQSSQNGSQGGSQSASQSGTQPGNRRNGATDPRVTQALSRLRDANEQMRQAASPRSGQSNAQQAANEAARRAAEQLRQATGLMGGAQQNQTAGRMDSLSQEADRIAQEERAQADRIRQFVDQQGKLGPMTTAQQMMDRAAARNRIANDRQHLSDDLSKLESNLRSTARQLAPTQPGVSNRLREALNGMDQDGLSNRVQRTADWLRRGINPESNGTEDGIRNGLDKLSQQVRQAQNGVGAGDDKRVQGQGRQPGGDQTAALGALDRFRSRIEAMSRGNNGNSRNGQQAGQQPGPNSSSRNGQSDQQQGQQGQPGGQPGGQRGQQGQAGQQGGQQGSQQAGQGGGQPGQPGGQQGGQQMAQGSRGGNRGGTASGDLGNTINRGGGDGGPVWGNINTGNNRFDRTGRVGNPGDPNNPADTEQAFSQGMRDLNRLRQAAGNDTAAQREIQELARQMQGLDPSRFPGNPEVVAQMGAQILGEVDKLELRLRQSDGTDPRQARTPKPKLAAPAYQNAVADYYRRLSKQQ